MNYELKDKIIATKDFLVDLITKSWQEAEALQQQINSIDTSSKLGADIVKLLKNSCTSYHVLIGCLESLADDDNELQEDPVEAAPTTVSSSTDNLETLNAPIREESAVWIDKPDKVDFEPFEYFVDFEEPVGEPLTDKDLYN